jgi:hypothetical protein
MAGRTRDFIAMKPTRQAVWIDDNPDRERTAKEFGAKFINVRNVEVALEIDRLLMSSQPSIVILDHILDKTKSKDRVFQRGSTIAQAIKEKWPSCPVVGVTNADHLTNVDVRTRGAYDVLISFHDFGKHIDQINAVIRGFDAVENTKRKTAQKLAELLRPPDEIQSLVSAIPEELKASVNDASVAAQLHHWVTHLIERPGFLLDSLWVATFLGLKEPSFQRVSTRFEDARYTGVFANAGDPRWWSCVLAELLYQHTSPHLGEMSWATGRRLCGMKADDFSRCYACDKEFPETVAYLDAKSNERHAMHLRCTVLHPLHTRELWFEDIRMMRGS